VTRYALGILAAALTAAAAGAAAASGRSLQEGLYSADQAKQGKVEYTASCAGCHLADLSGTLSGDGGAPPLRGEPFIAFIGAWNARQLFDYIRTTMPADDPSALTNTQYLDVMAYLFQVNGYLAGPAPLDLRDLPVIRMPAPPRVEGADRR